MKLFCFSKSDHPDFGDENESEETPSIGVQRKLSTAATFKKIMRTLTGQRPIELDDNALELESGVSKPKLERKPTLVESVINKLKRKPTFIKPTDPILDDEEYEYLQKFAGIWYSDFEKNKPGNVEIAKIMALGWGLKKALDNVPSMEVNNAQFLHGNSVVCFLVCIGVVYCIGIVIVIIYIFCFIDLFYSFSIVIVERNTQTVMSYSALYLELGC